MQINIDMWSNALYNNITQILKNKIKIFIVKIFNLYPNSRILLVH